MLTWLIDTCIFLLLMCGVTFGLIILVVRWLRMKYPSASYLVEMLLRKLLSD